MRLYVGPMDVVVTEVSAEGRVHLEREGWIAPTLQERRAILYTAEREVEALTELIEILQSGPGSP